MSKLNRIEEKKIFAEKHKIMIKSTINLCVFDCNKIVYKEVLSLKKNV